jgi:hypothetical protein
MRQNLVNFIVHKIIPKLVLYTLRLKLSKIRSLKIICLKIKQRIRLRENQKL